MIEDVENIYDDLGVLAERVSDVSRDGNQEKRQRRNQVVDVFGMEFTRAGDAQTPATFYLSISPDLIYYERFEFKIIVSSFAMPVAGSGTTDQSNVTIDPTNLSVSGAAVSPNPHTHTAQPHTHALSPGVTMIPSLLTDASVVIDGIDITSYLKAQYAIPWISGEGIYPGDSNTNYDILGVASQLPAWQQGVILRPGYKKVEFVPNGICNVTFVTYLKYSHTNR